MSVSIDVKFDDKATPPLMRLSQAVQRPDVRKVMGRAIATDLRKKFSEFDSTKANKLGGKRTHFWAQARRGVQQPQLVGGDGVVVAINQVGVAQRYFGGEIRPVVAKFLTIPVNPAAYGHRAREFSDLEPIFFPTGDGILVKKGTEGTKGIGTVYYRLVKSVYQDADPEVIPTDEELQTVAYDAGENYMRTLIERAKS